MLFSQLSIDRKWGFRFRLKLMDLVRLVISIDVYMYLRKGLQSSWLAWDRSKRSHRTWYFWATCRELLLATSGQELTTIVRVEYTFIPSLDKGESDHPAHKCLVLSEVRFSAQDGVRWGRLVTGTHRHFVRVVPCRSVVHQTISRLWGTYDGDGDHDI